LPLDPEVTVIHPAFEEAVQEHPLAVETETVPVPPDEVNDFEVGEIEYEHEAAPSCEMAKVLPAAWIVPLLELELEFEETLKRTVPLPFPLEPEVIETHDRDSLAVHEHPDWVETLMVPEPPLAPKC
jgi:hypothetical protein